MRCCRLWYGGWVGGWVGGLEERKARWLPGGGADPRPLLRGEVGGWVGGWVGG